MSLSYNTTEPTKNICCMKGKGADDHNTVTWLFKKFFSDHKNLDNYARSRRPKTVDSEAVLQAMEANLVSNTQKVPG